MAVTAQFVFRPNPGADFKALMALVKEGAELWRKYGATVSLWTVSVGEVGNMVFSARFDSFDGYAKCMDRLTADPAFPAWTQKNTAAGLTTWVRSNLARELPL